MDQPNVIFLLADQLRAASLPMYGEEQISTPSLDRLASTGITCTQADNTVFLSPTMARNLGPTDWRPGKKPCPAKNRSTLPSF
jgi:hypothetical protein